MIRNLRFLLAAILIFALKFSFAQVTLISNNTNIDGGFVLPNGRPLLTSDAGLLYTTNGTSASVITTSVYYSDSSSASVYKGIFYFGGDVASGHEALWATDGTGAGTRLVKDIFPSGYSAIDNFFVFNNLLYFTADDGVHGYELWSTDGTTGNTKLVTDINGKASGSIASDAYFLVNGSYTLFTAYNADSVLGLYKLTSAGVALVKNNFGSDILLSNVGEATAFGSKVVFTVNTGDFGVGAAQLWITDGNNSGTTLLKDFGSGTSGLLFPEFYLFKNKLFFAGLETNNELWTTDGTAAHTTLFKNFGTTNLGYSAIGLFSAVTLNNKLLFIAADDAHGAELWSTDGTAANTVIVKDINPGANDAAPTLLINEGAIQGIVSGGNINNFNFHQFYTSFNGKIYFTANDGTHGVELWSSDGTAANTQLVKDINVGSGDGVNNDNDFNSFYTTTGIYFDATNGTSGYEPWVTDGTSGGTKQVSDVKTGATSSNPEYQFIYNNQLYFTTYINDTSPDSDLYKINTPLTVLPVNLSSFIASIQPQSVLLNWTTAAEINTDHFDVERSVDGAHFGNIADVTATGNSNSAHTYAYNDYSALHLGSSTLYYRLKTIDKDGKFTYSSIIKLQLHNAEFSYSLSPNPVRNQLTVSFTTIATKQASIKITDGNGKSLYEKSLQGLQPGTVQQNINVAGLAAGVYYIQLITDSDNKTLRFVKQ